MSGYCIDAMNEEDFAQLVDKAVESLPQEFLDRLENVEVVVQDYPTQAQLKRSGLSHGKTLLGLYEGVPQTQRGSGYGMVLPDKITIFQKTIEAKCHSEAKVYTEVEKVLKHEIAHHFGISDERLREIGRGS